MSADTLLASVMEGDRARLSRLLGDFDSRSIPEPNTGCAIWLGEISERGYGRFELHSRRRLLAHRIAYELLIGPIPGEMPLDHACRVRCCVNVAHLEPVTTAENTRRGLRGALKTRCPQGHPWVPENILTYRHGGGGTWRRCRTCWREGKRRSGAKDLARVNTVVARQMVEQGFSAARVGAFFGVEAHVVRLAISRHRVAKSLPLPSLVGVER